MDEIKSLDDTKLVAAGLFTVHQASEWLQLSRSRIYELISEGELHSVRIGGSRRIPRNALVELAARALRDGKAG